MFALGKLERCIRRRNHGTPQAKITVVQHQRLPGRHRTLGACETHVEMAIIGDANLARFILLSITGLRATRKMRGRSATADPVHGF